MSEIGQVDKSPVQRSGASVRLFVAWVVGILFLLLLAWFIGGVIVPAWRVRAAVNRCQHDTTLTQQVITELGGPEKAAEALSLYLRLPERAAPHRRTAVFMMGQCREEGHTGVPAVLSALMSENALLRATAAEALGYMRAPQSVQPLIAAMKDEHPAVRKAAVEALGFATDSQAVEALVIALDDDEAAVRRAAMRSLGRIGDAAAASRILAKLKNLDPRVRSLALEALGGIIKAEIRRGRTQIEGLLRPVIAALDDKDTYVQRDAASVLVNIGSVAVDSLILKLKQGNKQAAWALGRIKDPRAIQPLITVLRSDNPRMVELANEALGTIGSPAIKPLIERFKNDKAYPVGRALLRIGKGAVGYLVTGLRDEDSDVRQLCAWALGRIADPRAIEPLAEALADRSGHVRLRAAESLAELGDSRAGQVLTTALKNKDSEVRARAVKALLELKDSKTVGPLTEALSDKSQEVRAIAARALGHMRSQRAVDPLIRALKDHSADVRSTAAWALGSIADRKAVPPLVAALRDKQARVRLAAASALGKLKDARATKSLEILLQDEDEAVRKEAAKSLLLVKQRRDALQKRSNDK